MPDEPPAADPRATAAAPERAVRPTGPPTLGHLEQNWSSVLDSVGRSSPLVREAMTRAAPVEVEEGRVRLQIDGGEVEFEGLSRNRSTIETALRGVLGRDVHVEFVRADAPAARSAPADPKRQTAQGDREARLKTYRAQDPALDAMADALDLELKE